MKKDHNKGSHSISPALEEMWKFSPSPPTHQLNYMEVNDGQPTAEAKQRNRWNPGGGWVERSHPPQRSWDSRRVSASASWGRGTRTKKTPELGVWGFWKNDNNQLLMKHWGTAEKAWGSTPIGGWSWTRQGRLLGLKLLNCKRKGWDQRTLMSFQFFMSCFLSKTGTALVRNVIFMLKDKCALLGSNCHSIFVLKRNFSHFLQ